MRLNRREIIAGGVTLALCGATRVNSNEPSISWWRGYARSPYGQMHFFIAAPTTGTTSALPLVCLHQSPVSGLSYQEFQSAMATDRLVLCADTAGYGNSDGPTKMVPMADYGNALAVALDALGIVRTDVLGFHTGNFVAAELAIQRPDLVRRLVMPGIPYYSAAQRREILGRYSKPRPYFSDPDYVGANYRRTVLDADNGLSLARRHDIFVSQLLAGTKSHFGFAAVRDYDADNQLQKIKQPVLLPILNETLAEPTRRASKLITTHTRVEMPDYDGWAWFLHPDAIAEPVRGFLAEADPTKNNADLHNLGTATSSGTGIFTGKTRRWRHYAHTRYGQMHFVSAAPERTKPTQPPLLLLHPSPMSGDIFADMQAVLATDRLVLCPDTAGFGNSDGPPQQSTMANLGAALNDAVADLDFDGPIDVFGFHTGSFVATEALVQAPNLFRRAILCGVPYYPAEQRQAMQDHFLSPYAFFTDPNYVDAMYKNMVSQDGNEAQRQRQLARFVDRMEAGPKGEWGPRAVFSYDADAGLTGITTPTLLMAFDEVMTEPTRDVHKLIPKADFVELPELAMMGFVTDPLQVATEIRRYLNTR
jgi:pimeloyl-ACP methyl ester carboxylesterase